MNPDYENLEKTESSILNKLLLSRYQSIKQNLNIIFCRKY